MLPSKNEWLAALEARHGKELQQKFSNAVVAICGLGGLGSNIAIALARAGVGKLVLIDYDRVDITNLHRQQYKATQIGAFKTDALEANLLEIAPYVEIQKATQRVAKDNIISLLDGADVVCEAFDNAEAKAMLVNEVLERLPNSYLVAASGMAGYETPNAIRTRRITKRLYLCGDGKSDVANTIGLVAPRVMLCAAHQAQTVLRILAEEYEV